jgi:hypothetical protein
VLRRKRDGKVLWFSRPPAHVYMPSDAPAPAHSEAYLHFRAAHGDTDEDDNAVRHEPVFSFCSPH